jgi:hypothetical protein
VTFQLGGSLGPAQRRVLAGHLEHRVDPRLGDVLVDPVDVVEDVLLDLGSDRAEHLVAAVELELQLGLGVGLVGPHVVVHLAVPRRATRERGELGATGVAQRVDQEEAVLRRRVARAEHRPGAGRAVDVRHAEPPVADDPQLLAGVGVGRGGQGALRRVAALDVALLDAEARVLEVVVDLRGLEARRRVDQVVVHPELVVVVRRAGARGQELEQIGPVDEPVGARGEDVPEPPASLAW